MSLDLGWLPDTDTWQEHLATLGADDLPLWRRGPKGTLRPIVYRKAPKSL